MKRLRTVAALAGLGALMAAPAASGQLTQEAPTPTVAPTTTAVPTQTAEPATAAVRMLQAPATVGAPELRQLTEELLTAPDGRVILLVPGDAKLDLDAGNADDTSAFKELRQAAGGEAELVVVQQTAEAEPDGAAERLGAVADERVRADGKRCTDACLRAALAALDLQGTETALADDLDGSRDSISTVLARPAPDGGGVTALWPALLLLFAAGVAGMAFWRSPRRRAAATAAVPEALGAPAQPEPPRPLQGRAEGGRQTVSSSKRRRRSPPLRNGAGRPAQVISVLDPEGYVELDRCLQRVYWATTDTPPPSPGGWVDIEDREGRLWAFPRQSSTRPTAGRGA